MRLNKYLAHNIGISRREADCLIKSGKVLVNNEVAILGAQVNESDEVRSNGDLVLKREQYTYLALNKPTGYVCSRKKQDEAPTIYDLLPEKYRHLKTVGRLDKDSSGLILLTDDGDFAQEMTHPSFAKEKIYTVELDRKLSKDDMSRLNTGVELKDGISNLYVQNMQDKQQNTNKYKVLMTEGRNRQIRRTFGELGYTITKLHRLSFGKYNESEYKTGQYYEVDP